MFFHHGATLPANVAKKLQKAFVGKWAYAAV